MPIYDWRPINPYYPLSVEPPYRACGCTLPYERCCGKNQTPIEVELDEHGRPLIR